MSTSKKRLNNDTRINQNALKTSHIYFDLFKILPLLLIVGILPFIIRLKLVPLEGPFYEFWNGQSINPDFFTYYKQIFIYVVTAWALLHTFLFTKKIKFTKAYYFMGAYGFLVILSTIFSKYPQIALHGFNERREGMWIILCYLLLMFSTINLVETEKQIKAIIYTLGASGAIISLISIFQYFGMDIFTTEFAKNIMISSEIQSQVKDFNIKFGEKYSYGVFYNPNYLGGYISFYALLMLSFAIISNNIRERALFAVFFILSMFALYGSRSEAGVLGIVGAIGLLILVFTARYIIKDKPKEEHKKLLLTRFLPILLSLIILPVSLSYIPISDNPLTRIRTEAVTLFQPSDLKGKDYKEIGPINDIKQIDEKTIELKIYGKVTRLNVDKDMNLNLIDDNHKLLFNLKIEGEKQSSGHILGITEYPCYINIVDKGNSNYSIHYYYNDRTWEKLDFLVSNGELSFTTPSFRKVDIQKDLYAKHIGFEERGKLASGRGYIWSRSIPLVFSNIIVGSGQDTFITEFPQYDIFGRQAENMPQYYWNILTDKPHNTFIQIGIHSGLISLLILLTGIVLLIFKSIKSSLNEGNINITIAIFSSAILGFLLSSVFNDSILAITPMIYILLGINVLGIIKSNN
ncbi:O-antigen ligase family protein [Acetoanaerobium noterae]|uniref:O-antigen ligase family protein n=1 Tax=Acetoanaerobium noterae TaxID=745369 RepID=UPI0013565E68|nr:O-antigen ligase family protein [Acetoanaerobium noterae]